MLALSRRDFPFRLMSGGTNLWEKLVLPMLKLSGSAAAGIWIDAYSLVWMLSKIVLGRPTSGRWALVGHECHVGPAL